ncbi:MAG: efflux RND transporter permease subunit [Burkholderiales bacterium]|nr:efflux RND transporter permease subunit [Burkholderiales bacterium]
MKSTHLSPNASLNLSEWALKHPQMVLFLLLMLSFAGLWSYGRLGQKEDPEFTVKAMLVQAYWPGSSAPQMADQVTDRLEKKLQEVAEIDYTTSYAKPGVTQIMINLREATPPAAVPQVWYQVRKKLGDIQHELPQGVRGPFFNDEFGDTFGNLYAITGAGFSPAELREFAEAARNEFLRVADVNKVDLIGVQDERIYVEVSNAKLASLGLDPSLIAAQLAATNTVDAAGTVLAGGEQVRLTVSGEFDSVEAIRNIGIRASSEEGVRQFRLGDIAEVRRGFVDPPSTKMRHQGAEAVGLAVSMRKGGDVIRLGEQLNATVARVQAKLPVGVSVSAVSDQPRVVKESVHEFKKSLAEAVAIVLFVSFFSLGLRTGLVVALSIPLVLAMTFLAMYVLDIELQRISLGALIISLGLLVDDAIIAVEMMALKLEQGYDRFRAATYAYTATAFPMLTGTLITAAGFLPVGLAKSGSGEYVFSLFQVVGISLMLSWIVAVIFTPYLGFKLLKEHEGASEEHAQAHEDAVYSRGIYARFRKLVEWCLMRRRWVIGTTVAAFVGSIGLFSFSGLVPQQFFPASDRPELMVDLWLPQAATFEASEAEVVALEKRLKDDPDVVAVTSYVGNGSPRFYLPLDVQTPNLNLGELMVMTKGGEARERVLAKIQRLFDTEFPTVRGRVNRLENGPPVGYPLQYRVFGSDPAQVQAVADRVALALRGDPHVQRVNQDWGERLKRLRVEVDQDKVRALGISSRAIKEALQGSISGSRITTYREGDDGLDVVARLIEPERSDLANLKDAKIYLRDGKFVPVSQLAHLSIDSEPSVLWRRNRVPTLTVRADVLGAEAPDVTLALKPRIDAIAAELPLGYGIEVGGAAESSAKAQASIFAVMPLMFAAVLLLLMLQLQDMKKMALVLLTAPLGLIGVSAILAAFRIPFGFVAMLGVIALAGMIIRNSVILVVQIDHDVQGGATLWHAIVESTVRRMRPIVLTALAAILAMIPLTHSVFWGPMAWAIMGGLAVATLLTLLFLPALYASWYGVRQSADVPSPAPPALSAPPTHPVQPPLAAA